MKRNMTPMPAVSSSIFSSLANMTCPFGTTSMSPFLGVLGRHCRESLTFDPLPRLGGSGLGLLSPQPCVCTRGCMPVACSSDLAAQNRCSPLRSASNALSTAALLMFRCLCSHVLSSDNISSTCARVILLQKLCLALPIDVYHGQPFTRIARLKQRCTHACGRESIGVSIQDRIHRFVFLVDVTEIALPERIVVDVVVTPMLGAGHPLLRIKLLELHARPLRAQHLPPAEKVLHVRNRQR